MQGYYGKRTGALSARAFAAFWAALVLIITLSAQPAAAPFAYITNSNFQCVGAVSVVDTGANPPAVSATVGVGLCPEGVAITPDGKHAYVANQFSSNVSVIDAATNTVVATIPVVGFPLGVAITPDGKYAYVTSGNSPGTVSVIGTATNLVVGSPITVGNGSAKIAVSPDGTHAYVTNSTDNTVSVIATATNTVVATITVGLGPIGEAVTPNGQHVYVGNFTDNTVSVIATATNTVVGSPIPVGNSPYGVAITPDGTHAYVTNASASGTVSVIDTASNTLVGTPIPVGNFPSGVAITPDGTRAYVANNNDAGTVSVIATASNTVMTTVPVGVGAAGIGIIPDVPFAAFSSTAMIHFGTTPDTDAFILKSSFTLGSSSKGINPLAQPVTFQVGTLALTMPPGSFTGTVTSSAFGPFFFTGTINGVSLHAVIAPTGAKRFSFQAGAPNASLTGTVNPVPVTLSIGNNNGTASVTATIHGGSASKVH